MKNFRVEPRLVPVIVFLIAAWFILLIPFKVIGYGFLPSDDAMRHSAKAISGKDWGDILVLREGIKMDNHPGWHALLSFLHKEMGLDAHSLVIFSVISLFLIFSLTPLIFLKHPEAWVASLLCISIIDPSWIMRLFLGRPYILPMAVLMVVLFLRDRIVRKRKIQYATLALIAFLIALSTWMHDSWYLYAFLIIAFFIAREWRAGFLLCAAWISGAILGASFTGHPIIFMKQALTHLFLSFGNNDIESMLVNEFRPNAPDIRVILFIFMILVWRFTRGKKNNDLIKNPAAILACIGLSLSFVTRRVWIDWGMPALLVLLAQEFECFFDEKLKIFSFRRVAAILVLAPLFYIAVTSDIGSRWSSFKNLDYLSSEDPKQKEWLPAPGGIIYSNSMGVFYKTFYKNPRADWRYILGFEPALMPEEDLKIYRDIQRYPWTTYYFLSWIEKMRPEDRLILNASAANKPNLPMLEWNYAAIDTWVGRKPVEKK
jgi:hypothetical protein